MNSHLRYSAQPNTIYGLTAAFRLLDDEVDRGEIPGGVALVTHQGKVAGSYAAGYAVDHGGEKVRAEETTIYDCASLTKVTVTLPLVLQSIGYGLVRLDDPVARFLHEFGTNGKEHITIRHLLIHTSGLPAHQKFYLHGWTPEEIIGAICRLPLEYKSDSKIVYSDLGYMLLGHIAAQVFGDSLDRVASEQIFNPLGMKDTAYCPPEDWKPRIAATEYTELLERCKRGEVHDENAYAMGGISGHAGLFSTAGDLAKYAMMWLNGGRTEDGRAVIPEACVQVSIGTHTRALSGRRGLGWVLKGDKMDVSGDLFSDSAYGHTGFTGVSLTIDPERDISAILLTNRVHYGRDKSVARLRACFHNAVAASF